MTKTNWPTTPYYESERLVTNQTSLQLWDGLRLDRSPARWFSCSSTSSTGSKLDVYGLADYCGRLSWSVRPESAPAVEGLTKPAALALARQLFKAGAAFKLVAAAPVLNGEVVVLSFSV